MTHGRMLSVSLDPAVRGRAILGLLQLEGVDPGAAQDPVHEEIGRFGEELRVHYREPSEAAALLRPARDLYKALGLDPTKIRPSSEALFRRLIKGRDLYRVNAVVDAANLCSLRMFLPVGLYDTGSIRGSIVLREGRAGESYRGIGKGEISVVGRWTLADDDGPFGNPSSDSWRTRITDGTRSILMVVFAPSGYDAGELRSRADDCAETLRRYCGGTLVGVAVVG